jgi:uncharacterized protein YbbK (DUF523 family)
MFSPGSIYIVSACLLGLRTRYDGRILPDKEILKRLKGCTVIPVCPEQLGGLPTPRIAADLTGGDGADVLCGKARVIRRDGVDVTENFIIGARQIAEIATRQHVDGIILKGGSPSCGLKPLTGVTAALLIAAGYAVEEA